MRKLFKLPYAPLVVAIFVLYLAITYWPNVAGLLKTLLAAAMPLLIGCVIAYIVNLLMVRYEGLYRRVFKGQRAQRFAPGHRPLPRLLINRGGDWGGF